MPNNLLNISYDFSIILSIILSFFIFIIFGNKLIKWLAKFQNGGQVIRDNGPSSHLITKVGTPTMGGVIIFAIFTILSIFVVNLENKLIQILIGSTSIIFILGFIDDYLKVRYRNSKGVKGRYKLLVQFITSILYISLLHHFTIFNNELYIPVIGHIDMGYWYYGFLVILLVGMSNSVNLTDGLDGLAIMPIIIILISFGYIAYTGITGYSNLNLNDILTIKDLSIIIALLVGTSFAFLWFNCNPAKIFMGDVGSLTFGFLIAAIAIILKQEIFLLVAGSIFIIESLSVIIQVLYFKRTKGKRFFLMSPIHHHFEKLGWTENKVVIRFWIFAFISNIIAIFLLMT